MAQKANENVEWREASKEKAAWIMQSPKEQMHKNRCEILQSNDEDKEEMGDEMIDK